MSDYEILKHLPDIAKVVTPVAAAIPFTGIVKRMLGPAADEVAEMWKDQIRLYRYGRQLKCIEKAEQMAKDAGFTPKAVPPKILFPLLDGASMEEDETLHTMWAALLANAASDKAEIVRPSYISMLKELAKDEAALLNWMVSSRGGDSGIKLGIQEVIEGYSGLGFGQLDFHELSRSTGGDLAPEVRKLGVCLRSLVANGSIFIRNPQAENNLYTVTWRGVEFVQACRPPEPTS